MRWEKTTRPFLRTLEFLWQEGHTAHATAEEAQEETLQMLRVYAEFCENVLAIPVVCGQKTESEKFAGALCTYTIESLMHDGKALQSGTSHNFGDGFAKAFDITYTDKNNELQYVHQTSWGLSTRLIGGIIMVHSDNDGLVLPPLIAPTQLIIIPIALHKDGVLECANEIKNSLCKSVRVKIDASDKSPGWKFSEYEMKGVPLRLEVGPRDIENKQVVLVRRDTRKKYVVPMTELNVKVDEILSDIQSSLFEKAKTMRDKKTYSITSFNEFENILNTSPGLIKAMWCGDEQCADIIKEKTSATARCIPFEQQHISDNCICCAKPAKKLVYWAKAY